MALVAAVALAMAAVSLAKVVEEGPITAGSSSPSFTQRLIFHKLIFTIPSFNLDHESLHFTSLFRDAVAICHQLPYPIYIFLSRVNATLHGTLSVGRSVGWSVA